MAVNINYLVLESHLEIRLISEESAGFREPSDRESRSIGVLLPPRPRRNQPQQPASRPGFCRRLLFGALCHQRLGMHTSIRPSMLTMVAWTAPHAHNGAPRTAAMAA